MSKISNLNKMTAEILAKFPEAKSHKFTDNETSEWIVYESFSWWGSDEMYRSFTVNYLGGHNPELALSLSDDEEFIEYLINISEKYGVDFLDQRTWTRIYRDNAKYKAGDLDVDI